MLTSPEGWARFKPTQMLFLEVSLCIPTLLCLPATVLMHPNKEIDLRINLTERSCVFFFHQLSLLPHHFPIKLTQELHELLLMAMYNYASIKQLQSLRGLIPFYNWGKAAPMKNWHPSVHYNNGKQPKPLKRMHSYDGLHKWVSLTI